MDIPGFLTVRPLRMLLALGVAGLVALVVAGLGSHSTQADTVNGQVFLQGNYVELGIHSAGSFGTSENAPAGYHPLNRTTLGFVADLGKDGWTTGTPNQTGDYFLPGSAEERWGVEWTVGGSERTFFNAGARGTTDITKTSLTDTSSGDTRSAEWIGTAINGSEELKITQNVSFDVNDLFFVMRMTLENVGSVTLESPEYLRTVDPDNDKDLTGGAYTTSNYVSSQPGVGGNVDEALVVAKGTVFTDVTLGLAAVDSRAKVSVRTPNSLTFSGGADEILDSPNAPAVGSPTVADTAIGLAFRFDTLAPGASVTFAYAYILSAGDLSTALAALEVINAGDPTPTPPPEQEPEPRPGEELVAMVADDPKIAASRLCHIFEKDPLAAATELAEASGYNADSGALALLSLLEMCFDSADTVLAIGSGQDPAAIGQAIAIAAKVACDTVGGALASAAAEDPGSVGSALARASAVDPEAVGCALVESTSADAEATGLALAKAAGVDAGSTGKMLAKAAEADIESTGKVLALAAKEDPKAIGNSIVSAVGVAPVAMGHALIRGVEDDSVAVAEALAEATAIIMAAANPAPVPPKLIGAKVTPESQVADRTGTVRVSFSVVSPLLADAKILVTFPIGFTLGSEAPTKVVAYGLGGRPSARVSGQTVSVTWPGGSEVKAGTRITLHLSNVKNPPVAGRPGAYSIETTDASGGVIDADHEVESQAIIPETVTAASVRPQSLITGAVGDVIVALALTNSLPGDSQIVVTFPEGFTLNSGAATSLGETGIRSGGKEIDGEAKVSVSGQSVIISRVGGTEIDTGQVITLRLTNIKNPDTAGLNGDYSIKTIRGGSS